MNEWQQLMEKHAVQEDKSLTVKYTNKKNRGIWEFFIFLNITITGCNYLTSPTTDISNCH